ncbi:MAG: AAA family ATPase [Gammaproteobacteria bacterium]|nr:AAA family ATPase [Gammaproteobacteria bacterium]
MSCPTSISTEPECHLTPWINITLRFSAFKSCKTDSDCCIEITHETRHYDPEIDLQKLPAAYQDKLRTIYSELKIKPCHSHFLHFPANQAEGEVEKWVSNLINHLLLSVGKLSVTSTADSTSSATHATEPQELLDELKDKPFVFLVSESGAGKSYLMEHRLSELESGVKIYHDVKEWTQSTATYPILFIDEANISKEDYFFFDNLAKGERVIWLNGNKYTLSENHKVVFAGNPDRYGGRFQADLLRRFPYYKEFRGKPILEIIEPLLKKFADSQQAGELIQKYYCEAQRDGLTITPRNAKNICLTAYAIKEQFKKNNIFDVPEVVLIYYAILNELKTLNIDKSKSKKLRKAIKEGTVWKTTGQPMKEALTKLMPDLGEGDYEWTPSRRKIALILLGMLRLREERMKEGSDIKQEHGVNGFLIEGKPGLGKTRLCYAMLKALGIEPVIIQLGKPEEARQKLLEAFHHGDVVLIDEFNSLTDEKLLNDLLSGIDPKKNPPEKPGFCILGTQNPISFKNRELLSPALENRLMTVELKKYTVDELKHILMRKFHRQEIEAETLIKERKEAKRYGKQHRLFPLPGTRDLFTEAGKVNSTPSVQSSSSRNIPKS